MVHTMSYLVQFILKGLGKHTIWLVLSVLIAIYSALIYENKKAKGIITRQTTELAQLQARADDLENSLLAEKRAVEEYYAQKEKTEKELVVATSALQKTLEKNVCAKQSLPSTTIDELRRATSN